MKYRLFTLTLALAGAAANAADIEAGRHKAGTCLGCHGVPTYANVYPSYHVPKLAGQHAAYIVAALKGYQTGERDHPTMRAQTHRLSEGDMADIAAFFSSLPADTAGERQIVNRGPRAALPEAQKQKLQVCVSCHGEDGNSPLPENPRIAGQYRDYLHRALLDYKEGRRKNAVMLGMIGLLDEHDMKVFAAYFSSHKGLGVVDIGDIDTR